MIKRTFIAALCVLAIATAARFQAHAAAGLRGQYFNDAAFDASPAFATIDRDVSTATIYRRWNAAPPERFGVQWSGYVSIDDPGLHSFLLWSDGHARLYIDGRLVVENRASPDPASTSGAVALDPGPHAIVVQYGHDGGRMAMEWSWWREHESPQPIPDWRLSTTRQTGVAALAPWIDRLWWVTLGMSLLLGAAFGLVRILRRPARDVAWLAVRIGGAALLAWLYLAGATRHADEVNTFKARGDQSGYLWDAEQVYANLRGRTPPVLIGVRARMPVYAAYLSLFYTPRLTDPEFFLVAKVWNIRLSIALLALLAVLFASLLPPLVSTNLTLIVAFGYYVFKAGYAQPELLFYFLYCIAFVAGWRLLVRRERGSSLLMGIVAGTAAGLAYLTKALVPPFVALLVGTYAVQEIAWFVRAAGGGRLADRRSLFLWRAAAGLAVAVCFFSVVYPYIANSKRVFGSYFYNQNTTYYIWYDNGTFASVATVPYTDFEGRIAVPVSELPTPLTYWRSHTIGQIASRLQDGFKDMAVRSYRTYEYLPYAILYSAFALALILSNWRAFLKLVREHAAVFAFLVMYTSVYLTGTAFFVAISGTGSTRFLLAHAMPFFFVLSCFFVRAPFSETEWTLGRIRVTTKHFHLLVLAVVALQLAFRFWPRLLNTYGGF